MARSGGRSRNNLPKARTGQADRPSATRRAGVLISAAAARVTAAARRRPWPAAGIGVVVLAALIALVIQLIPDAAAPYRPSPRARQYADYTACLLTDEAGVTGAAAAPIWAGMQQASAKTSEQVSYLAIQGDQSLANAESYFNTLAGRGCATILAAGVLPAQAAAARSATYPKITVLSYPGTGDSSAASTTSAVESALVKAFQSAH